MNRKFICLLLILCAAISGFAQEESPWEEEFLEEEFPLVENGDEDAQIVYAPEEPVVIPSSILNNQYYLQSIRLNNQAKVAFEEGNYDASALFAEQAAEYARLSDEYVHMRLAENAFAKAHSRYTWAGSVGAANRYPAEYRTATTAYNDAVAARQDENWDTVSAASNRVIIALANVKSATGEAGPSAGVRPQPPQGALPAQYTVRLWTSYGDCFSAIAGWAWVYGNENEWRRLYEANKNKIPDPNNPHLILPGMILDIPSLPGEARSGMWDPAGDY